MKEHSLFDRGIQTIIYCILIAISIVTLFPFFYVAMVSVTSESEVIRKGIVLIPDQFVWGAYKTVFSGSFGILTAYKITLLRTGIGTLLNMIATTLAAYVLSRKGLPGRSSILFMIIFTILFSGGTIPTYLVVKSLGLIDSLWALILPGLVSAFNLIIIKGFFEQLPSELLESATVDGAGELTMLWRIVLPLSLPSIVTIGLFYAVGHWNSYFDGVLYINDRSLWPLQVVLRTILLQSQMQDVSQQSNDASVSSVAIQMAAVIVSTVPILLVYPFVQKHFAKGVLIGAVKG
ncbi:carbohydrate ABC transporter permease [Paenibacillus sedimenti]|uniref:Carbohydrate ABC transporter permease n=1 Tax=Paenibacillus sedimenti TaxID=2770274 RepID=A0A926QIL4_9BACL|nr:carbohydrate ABC transporter permease [Paenibacillus sedimenti]MBD0379738.1 carbohydrate ABC transporter permease [Paenibacillus sedimenti]